MIVLEGADNSGKTTFSKGLERLGLHYFSAGPAPKTVAELSECLKDQWLRAGLPCVQDRITCISQMIYSDAPEAILLRSKLDEFVASPLVVIVYCRPPERTLVDFSTHKIKSYDTEEHLEKLIDRQHEYMKSYDDLMETIPHIVYDWTEHDKYTTKAVQDLLNWTQRSKENCQKFVNDMHFKRVF